MCNFLQKSLDIYIEIIISQYAKTQIKKYKSKKLKEMKKLKIVVTVLLVAFAVVINIDSTARMLMEDNWVIPFMTSMISITIGLLWGDSIGYIMMIILLLLGFFELIEWAVSIAAMASVAIVVPIIKEFEKESKKV